MKKAQVTIFAIISILIATSIFILFFVRNQEKGGKLASEDFKLVKSYADDCIKTTTERAVYFVSLKGGYFPSPTKSIDWQGLELALYFDKGVMNMPTKKDFENAISEFVNVELPFCIGSFSMQRDFEISAGDIKTETMILDNEIKVKVDYPISVRIENSTYNLKRFDASLPLRTGILRGASETIIKEYMNDGLCLTCLVEMSEKQNFVVDMLDYNDATILTLKENLTNSALTFAVWL